MATAGGVGALLGASLMFAAPASATEAAPVSVAAAGYCYGVAYDQSNGDVTASCQGAVYITVSCHAVWPYSPWTDQRYYNFGSGYSTIITDFASCPWPASYDVLWSGA